MKAIAISAALMLLSPGLDAAFLETPLNQQPIDRAGEWDYRQDGAGGLWVSYYDHSQTLHLRWPEGGDKIIPPIGDKPGQVEQGQNSSSQSGLSLAALPKGLQLLWREKFPNKKFFLWHSQQPEQSPLAIGEGTEPLTRLKTEFFNDKLHLLWYGERGDPELNQRNFIYYQNLTPNQSGISAVERLFPGIYPVWAHDADGNIMAFSWIEDDKGGRIVSRFKGPAESEFGSEVTLAEVQPISHIFRAWQTKGKWFALWQTSRNERQSLEGAVSDDKGVTWRPFTFQGLDNWFVNSLNVTVGDNGRIFLALSANDLSDPRTKQDVWLLQSSDLGETWQYQRPRPDSVAKRYRALNPALVLGPSPGQLAMVWEDWRNIRSQLVASFSNDLGATWEISNLPLPQPTGVNRGLPDAFPSLYVKDDVYHVITQQAVDDGFGAYNLIDLSFAHADLVELQDKKSNDDLKEKAQVSQAPASISSVDPQVQGVGEAIVEPVLAVDQREEALHTRATRYWQAMVEKDFNTSYAMHDPFFRARVSQHSYLTLMGRISYRNPVVEAIEIEDAYARVTVRFTASIPPFRARTGEIISRPDKEILLTEVWLWVDGDWYREYYSEAQDVRFTRY